MDEAPISPQLQEYARARSPAAFGAIVDRYVNLVYASALRHVNDRDLAADITQMVFTTLAQKAQRVSQDRPLSAWLLATTRYVALNERRQRDRRRKLEQKVAAMNYESRTPQHDQPDWNQFGPLVDEGLSRLREADRDAVMLRFFECRSLREVGAALGISEAAATKRVTRALERLRRFFVGRGVTTADVAPALAVLAGGSTVAPQVLREALVAIAAHPATTTTAGAAAGTSIFGAIGTGAGTMLASKVASVAAVVAIVTCGAGIVMYAQATSKPAAPQRVAVATTKPAPTTTKAWPNPAEQRTLLAVRDECFPPEVCNYLLANRTLLSGVAAIQGQRVMTQATALDSRAGAWLGIVMSASGNAQRTLNLGNTDTSGPSGIVSETGDLFPVQRVRRNPNGPGRWRVNAKIDEPWEVGERRTFCWLMQGWSKPRATADGGYPLKIANHPGIDCIQQLVLITPKGWKMRSSSEPEASKQSVGEFVIYFWQKEVTSDQTFQVDVVVERN